MLTQASWGRRKTPGSSSLCEQPLPLLRGGPALGAESLPPTFLVAIKQDGPWISKKRKAGTHYASADGPVGPSRAGQVAWVCLLDLLPIHTPVLFGKP